jgi:capsular polysaccharide biosynthesis protein
MEVREYWRANATRDIEPRFVARIPGGRVFGTGAILSPDGKSVARDVSVDFGRSQEDHWLLAYPKIRPPVALAGATAVAATALGHGYAHWLLEELPRLLALRTTACDRVLAHMNEPFARAAMAALRLEGEIVQPRRLDHFECSELLVPSLAAPPGFPTQGLVEELNEFASTLRADESIPRAEKIYVSRAKSKRRTVANEPELWSMLESRGFCRVFLEDWCWGQQIEIFRSAREIVGAHGAGLANLVFCKPGTRVTELFNRRWMNGCYWRLASVVGLDYHPLESLGGNALAEELEANGDQVVANVGAVLARVSAARP